MAVEGRKTLQYLLLTLLCFPLSTPLEELENVDEPADSYAMSILDLLDNLQDSHGEIIGDVLSMLLDRVENHTVTEKEARAIRDKVTFIDDPRAKDILEAIGEVLSSTSLDDILLGAFNVFEDFIEAKSGGGDPVDKALPTVKFADDNRTYVVSQLDMLIPEEEIETDRKGRVKRKAVIDEERLLWKSGIIPYHINESQFSSTERDLIKEAMDHWELYTCLEFRERRSTDFNSVLIQADGRGCLSNAGQIGGTQHLALANGCKTLPIIIHELGHAIGLYHEHMRRDRDNHVEILWENIINPRYTQDFLMCPEKHWLEDVVPYDYRSVMHYGQYFRARKANVSDTERPQTILTKDELFQDSIGKAKWASFDDIKTVSLLYNCSEGCEAKKCPDDGFLGKRCTCWCRGPRSDIPVEACKKEVSCSPPQIDLNVYQVYHFETPEQIHEFELDIPSGTKLRVDHVDIRCGDALVTIQCRHGVWDLPLPPCEPEPCNIKSEWAEIYNFGAETYLEQPGVDIHAINFTHGSKLTLTCISEIEKQTFLECSYGNWTGLLPFCPEIGGRCLIENSSSIIYTDGATGEVIYPGETVKHGYTVVALCDPELRLYVQYDDIFDFNLTCSDGKLLGNLPVCPEPPVPCPDVPNGQIKKYPPFIYQVKCDDGFKLEEERLHYYCDRNGTWSPFVPKCIAKKCTIPEQNAYKGYIKNAEGSILSEDTQVESGQTVTFQCPRAFVPGMIDLSCHAERWNTLDGNLPVCKEVFCSRPPPVRNSSYEPHLRVYRYGDVVKINDCQGNLEPVGPSDLRIECLADGSWSASFYCRKFCDGGTIEEVEYSNQIVKAKPAKSYANISNVKKCRKRCINQKRFLCLSYVYGFDSDKQRWVCLLFKVDPSKNMRLLESKGKHFVFARTCKE